MAVYRIGTRIPFDSNIYLVIGRSAVLIDTGTGLDSDNVIKQIRDLLDGIRLSAVFLTHCHADHTGGLSKIIGEFGCPAYIGEPDMGSVVNGDRSVTFADSLGIDICPVPCSNLTPGEVFDLGEHCLEVIPTPGHTVGGVCFFDRITDSLFSGDTVFKYGYGRTDLKTGDSKMLYDSLIQLSNVNIGTLYPGHGPSTVNGKQSVEQAIKMMEEQI